MWQRGAVALMAMAATVLAAPYNSFAADLPVAPPPVKAPAMVPPVLVPNWSGFYVNGGFGYGLWTATSTTSAQLPEPVMPFEEFRGGQGWLARVGAGYDYQFGSSIVAGVFADFDYSSLKGTIRDGFAPHSADIRQTSSWAAGARVGLLATPEILSYVNAGFTSARFSSGTMVEYFDCSPLCVLGQLRGGTPTGYVSPAFTANGWFLGGGVETALSGGWFWRNEYRYAYYGNEAIQDINVFAGPHAARLNDINFKPTVQTFTTQIAYKFNSGPIPERMPRGRSPGSWTGIHLDGGIGYGQWAADLTSTQIPASNLEGALVVPQREGGKGWLGRVGGGYDYQFNRFVAGAFADFDFSSLKGTLSDPIVLLSGDIKQQWSWAAGGRAGVLLTPDILAYVDGGYSSAHFSPTTLTDATGGVASPPGSQAYTSGFTRGGWFAGAGTEYALTSVLGYQLPIHGLFWRNEYRYANYGTQVLSVPVNAAAGSVHGNTQLNDISFKPTVQTITTQLVYRFGSGG